jgi:hypothetical protein
MTTVSALARIFNIQYRLGVSRNSQVEDQKSTPYALPTGGWSTQRAKDADISSIIWYRR